MVRRAAEEVEQIIGGRALRRCTQCKAWYPKWMFSPSGQYLHSACRPCRRKTARKKAATRPKSAAASGVA